MLLSAPKGIMFAAMFVPRIDTIQQKAQRNTAVRVPADQYRSIIAVRRSHGFQSWRPQALLIAAVDNMPSEAESVIASGLTIRFVYMDPDLVLLQRAMSGWFVIRVAVLPMPLLIAYTKNQPQTLPDETLELRL